MERIKKIVHRGKKVIVVDYSDCKDDEMIILLAKAKELILTERENVLTLSIFNRKNFVTTKFMRHLEKELKEVEQFIQKNAVVGLSQTQLWILKGINIWYKKTIHHFESPQTALDFLVEVN